MARIAGVDLPPQKRVEIALTYIYGIGRKSARDIVASAGIDPNLRTKDLHEDQIKRIREVIESTRKVEGDLRREVTMNIKRLMDLGCYRRLRHRKGLPGRGQRAPAVSRAAAKRPPSRPRWRPAMPRPRRWSMDSKTSPCWSRVRGRAASPHCERLPRRG